MSARSLWDGGVLRDSFDSIHSSLYEPVLLSRTEVDRIVCDAPTPRTRSGSSGHVSSNDESNHNHTPREMVNVDAIEDGKEYRSTFMIRKFPRYLTSNQFIAIMTSTGLLDEAYDLLYVPVFSGGAGKNNHNGNRGYAFINFKTPALGALFVSILRYSPESDLGRHLGSCEIVFAHVQGKIEMLSHFVLTRNNHENPALVNAPLPPGLILL